LEALVAISIVYEWTEAYLWDPADVSPAESTTSELTDIHTLRAVRELLSGVLRSPHRSAYRRISVAWKRTEGGMVRPRANMAKTTFTPVGS
jgi:hypothetical protein